MAPKYSASELARRQKDPGLRSKLPSKYLTAAQRAQREQNARLNAPVTPGSSYTNRQAAVESKAAVQQKYGDADAQLTEQLQRSQGVQSQIPGWYQQYRDVLNAANQGQAAGYAAAAQQYQALQTGIQGQAAQGTAPQELQTELANLGGPSDLGATQVAANAAAQRGAYAGNLGQVVAAQGANNAAYGAAQVGASGKSQLEALQSELDEERKVRTSQGTLAKEKGAFDVTNRQAITDRERKSLLENKAFDLDVTNTLQDNQVARTNAATAQTNSQTQQQNSQNSQTARAQQLNKYGFTTKQWNALAESEKQKWRSGSYTRNSSGRQTGQGAPRQEPASSIGVRRGINARSATITKYMQDHPELRVRPGDGAARAKLVAAFRRDHAGWLSNPNEEYSTRAAIDLATGGKIQNATLRYLRKQGIYVTSSGDYYGDSNRGS